MASTPISIKLRCTSWKQLAALYERDLIRNAVFLKSSAPPPLGTPVRINLTLPTQVLIIMKGAVSEHVGPGGLNGRGPGVDIELREVPEGAMALIESALASARGDDAAGLSGGQAEDEGSDQARGSGSDADEGGAQGDPGASAAEGDGSEAAGEDLVPELRRELESLRKLNPFQILGVGYETSDEAVNRAFAALSKRYHPERFAGNASSEAREIATAVFALIRTAYRSLNNAEARARTLKELEDKRAQPGAGAGPEQAAHAGGSAESPAPSAPPRATPPPIPPKRKPDATEQSADAPPRSTPPPIPPRAMPPPIPPKRKPQPEAPAAEPILGQAELAPVRARPEPALLLLDDDEPAQPPVAAQARPEPVEALSGADLLQDEPADEPQDEPQDENVHVLPVDDIESGPTPAADEARPEPVDTMHAPADSVGAVDDYGEGVQPEPADEPRDENVHVLPVDDIESGPTPAADEAQPEPVHALPVEDFQPEPAQAAEEQPEAAEAHDAYEAHEAVAAEPAAGTMDFADLDPMAPAQDEQHAEAEPVPTGPHPLGMAAEPRFVSAVALIDAGKFQEALGVYKVALRRDPDDKGARVGIELCEGLKALAARDRMEAAQRFEAVLEMDPTNQRVAQEIAEMTRQAALERKSHLTRLRNQQD